MGTQVFFYACEKGRPGQSAQTLLEVRARVRSTGAAEAQVRVMIIACVLTAALLAYFGIGVVRLKIPRGRDNHVYIGAVLLFAAGFMAAVALHLARK